MAFDEGLADRLRQVVPDHTTEKRMFGGLAFMDRGNMCVGIVGETLMLRLGPDYEAALGEPHVREMDFTGRSLRGFVYVDPPGFASEDELADWVGRALAFTAKLPAK